MTIHEILGARKFSAILACMITLKSCFSATFMDKSASASPFSRICRSEATTSIQQQQQQQQIHQQQINNNKTTSQNQTVNNKIIGHSQQQQIATSSTITTRKYWGNISPLILRDYRTLSCISQSFLPQHDLIGSSYREFSFEIIIVTSNRSTAIEAQQ